ncbi:MAG: hypothetical protein NXH75_00025 [Halobacteriovoraceae bacterium]|nr:hypothetical protein [Halobacteriovoraceae bacterium]
MSDFKELFGLDLYSEMANEETNIFNRRENWNPEDSVDEKFSEYMRPHSLSYFSRLRPIFSFEIKDLSSLSGFSHVLFRDGILFLLRFFQIHPEPAKLRTKILIQKELAFLVPKAWENNVLLYRTVFKSGLSELAEPRKKLILAVTFGEMKLEKKAIKDICQNILKETSIEQVTIIPFYNILRGEDFLSYDRASLFSQMGDIKTQLSRYEIEFLDYSQRGILDYSECLFHQFNPGKVYFADSLLDHDLLGGGAVPLIKKESTKIVSLSPYHGMEVSPFQLDKEQKQKKERLDSFPKKFDSEPTLSREKEDFFDIFYYSKNILKLAYELGKGIF